MLPRGMMVLRTHTKTEISGTKNSWSLISEDVPSVARTMTRVDLEIQGKPSDGYHLVMAPDGFFAADNWYETIEEAILAGEELFGIPRNQWETVGGE